MFGGLAVGTESLGSASSAAPGRYDPGCSSLPRSCLIRTVCSDRGPAPGAVASLRSLIPPCWPSWGRNVILAQPLPPHRDRTVLAATGEFHGWRLCLVGVERQVGWSVLAACGGGGPDSGAVLAQHFASRVSIWDWRPSASARLRICSSGWSTRAAWLASPWRVSRARILVAVCLAVGASGRRVSRRLGSCRRREDPDVAGATDQRDALGRVYLAPPSRPSRAALRLRAFFISPGDFNFRRSVQSHLWRSADADAVGAVVGRGPHLLPQCFGLAIWRSAHGLSWLR
jgi:hypothetical protein